MAEHSVDILLRLAGPPRPDRDQIRAALVSEPGMSELSWMDFNRLAELSLHLAPEHLRGLLMEILGRQASRWVYLGHPDTHEGWASSVARTASGWDRLQHPHSEGMAPMTPLQQFHYLLDSGYKYRTAVLCVLIVYCHSAEDCWRRMTRAARIWAAREKHQ
jgi:hypothetical protein